MAMLDQSSFIVQQRQILAPRLLSELLCLSYLVLVHGILQLV